MKRPIAFLTLGTLLLMSVILLACSKEESPNNNPVSSKTLKAGENPALPIYMGQNTLIGEAFIYIQNESIMVQVSLVDGIVPDAAHLYAGENPPPSPAPGQFPYHWYPGDSFPVMFTIDISDWYECQAFDWYFALHFEIGNETAWILPEEGGIFWYNKKGKKMGWGQYFLYYFAECDGGVG